MNNPHIGPLSLKQKIERRPLVLSRMRAQGLTPIPVWVGCDGSVRKGRTGDMIQMFEDINEVCRLQ